MTLTADTKKYKDALKKKTDEKAVAKAAIAEEAARTENALKLVKEFKDEIIALEKENEELKTRLAEALKEVEDVTAKLTGVKKNKK